MRFSYEKEREILHGVDMEFPVGSLTAIVGESGCGKSTISGILTGRNKGYTGSVTIGGVELREISDASLLQNITYVGSQNYLFRGTVRENLQMGAPGASDEQLWAVLEQVNLAAFLKDEQGLDTPLSEKASNLSGGQCQRLALARALLHDSPVYIFDEATSNIDVESENDIMAGNLPSRKAQNGHPHLTSAGQCYGRGSNLRALTAARVAESSAHEALLQSDGVYKRLWDAQQALENYGKDGEQA